MISREVCPSPRRVWHANWSLIYNERDCFRVELVIEFVDYYFSCKFRGREELFFFQVTINIVGVTIYYTNNLIQFYFPIPIQKIENFGYIDNIIGFICDKLHEVWT